MTRASWRFDSDCYPPRFDLHRAFSLILADKPPFSDGGSPSRSPLLKVLIEAIPADSISQGAPFRVPLMHY